MNRSDKTNRKTQHSEESHSTKRKKTMSTDKKTEVEPSYDHRNIEERALDCIAKYNAVRAIVSPGYSCCFNGILGQLAIGGVDYSGDLDRGLKREDIILKNNEFLQEWDVERLFKLAAVQNSDFEYTMTDYTLEIEQCASALFLATRFQDPEEISINELWCLTAEIRGRIKEIERSEKFKALAAWHSKTYIGGYNSGDVVEACIMLEIAAMHRVGLPQRFGLSLALADDLRKICEEIPPDDWHDYRRDLEVEVIFDYLYTDFYSICEEILTLPESEVLQHPGLKCCKSGLLENAIILQGLPTSGCMDSARDYVREIMKSDYIEKATERAIASFKSLFVKEANKEAA